MAESVAGPLWTPVKYGLLSYLTPTVDGSRAVYRGAQWEELACPSGTTPNSTFDQCGLEEVSISADVQTVVLDPFTVTAGVKCHPMGRSPLADPAVVLEQRESHLVESWFWKKLSNPEGEFEPRMQSQNVTSAEALAVAEDWIASTYAGGTGVIHMPRKTASKLGFSESMDGDWLVTNLGTPVIAGSGYSSQPESQIYVTPAVFGMREESPALGEVVDVGRNDFYQKIHRSWVLGFGGCRLLRLNLTDTTPQN